MLLHNAANDWESKKNTSYEPLNRWDAEDQEMANDSCGLATGVILPGTSPTPRSQKGHARTVSLLPLGDLI